MSRVRTYRIEITTAWWWTWLYVPGVVTMALLGGIPDWGKVARMAVRAKRIRLVEIDPRVLDA